MSAKATFKAVYGGCLNYYRSIRGSPNGTIGNSTNGSIGLPMVPLTYQWYHWLTIGTNCTIGTNGITIGTIGKTLNNIGIPLVPLGNPEHTHYQVDCSMCQRLCC